MQQDILVSKCPQCGGPHFYVYRAEAKACHCCGCAIPADLEVAQECNEDLIDHLRKALEALRGNRIPHRVKANIAKQLIDDMRPLASVEFWEEWANVDHVNPIDNGTVQTV